MDIPLNRELQPKIAAGDVDPLAHCVGRMPPARRIADARAMDTLSGQLSKAVETLVWYTRTALEI